MASMKREPMGEAERHAIRRKIDEKQVTIREQRKVRERLSRECTDMIKHIATATAVIKNMKIRHEEKLNEKRNDFAYETALERREVQKLEEKRAELERVVASSDVIEREQRVLSERLAALRVDDEKEEIANAREMDALKRKTFNIRNELENTFRTTLHDLNAAYQEQAFDAMVQEANTARVELPSLRKDLCTKTRNVNKIIASQAISFEGAGQAKMLRDMTEEAVRLQGKRLAQLRRGVEGNKQEAAKVRTEVRDIAADLEDFKGEADELRTQAAELHQLRAETASKQKECIRLQRWVETLAKQGPRALKSETKRQRLATATSELAASFKSSSTSPTRTPPAAIAVMGNVIEKSAVANISPESAATAVAADTYQYNDRNNRGSLLPVSNNLPPPPNGNQQQQQQHQRDDQRDGRRYDNNTLVDGTEQMWRASLSHLGQKNPTSVARTAQQETGKLLPHREADNGSVTDNAREVSFVDGETELSCKERSEERSVKPEQSESSFRDGGWPSVWKNSQPAEQSSSSATKYNGCSMGRVQDKRGNENYRTGITENGVAISEAKDKQERRPTSSSSSHEAAEDMKPPTGPPQERKMSPEALASILLSEHNLLGDSTYACVLNRARRWAKLSADGRRAHDGDIVSKNAIHTPQPQPQPQQRQQQQQQQAFPDLPYGFTELGRRLNVEVRNCNGKVSPRRKQRA